MSELDPCNHSKFSDTELDAALAAHTTKDVMKHYLFELAAFQVRHTNSAGNTNVPHLIISGKSVTRPTQRQFDGNVRTIMAVPSIANEPHAVEPHLQARKRLPPLPEQLPLGDMDVGPAGTSEENENS